MAGGADPAQVSGRAIDRGLHQVGSLGSGNHFLEVQAVDEIFDPTAAERVRAGRGPKAPGCAGRQPGSSPSVSSRADRSGSVSRAVSLGLADLGAGTDGSTG